MTQDATESKVIKIIAEVFGVPADQLDTNSSSKTITVWDSLAHLKLVMELENRLKISFNTEEVFAMDTVGKICDVVNKHVK